MGEPGTETPAAEERRGGLTRASFRTVAPSKERPTQRAGTAPGGSGQICPASAEQTLPPTGEANPGLTIPAPPNGPTKTTYTQTDKGRTEWEERKPSPRAGGGLP